MNINEAAEIALREVYSQREEILRAFIAKYGFEPERAVQITDGTRWFVRRMTDEEWDRASSLSSQL